MPRERLLPFKLLKDGPESLSPAQIHRLLTVMIRCASRDREIAELLAGTPRGGLLEDVPDDIDLSIIESALPRANANLRDVAAAVAAHAVRHHDKACAGWRDLDAQAESARPIIANGTRLLSNLAVRLADLERKDDALAAAEEAVSLYRRLAEADRDAHLPGLATSLNNLVNMLAEVRRDEHALAAAREAVELNRQLAEVSPAASRPDLARSLNNLANALAGVGRNDEAIATTEQTIQIRRQLAEENPVLFRPELARSLHNFAARLAAAGRREEALAAAKEAVQIRRQLAVLDIPACRHDLARSLHNLSIRQAEAECREDAVIIRRSRGRC